MHREIRLAITGKSIRLAATAEFMARWQLVKT
jgi:hypothetical protein